MKTQEWELSLKFHFCFMAALTIAVGQDIVYYKCRDFQVVATSKFAINCEGGKIIIVKSAVIGVTEKFNPSYNQCPITNNTCLMDITYYVAELCTGRNSCDINQNFLLYNESKIPCASSGMTTGNFINIKYACIDPVTSKYGDICHFNEALYNNATIYISSYPNFPDVMGQDANFQCACLFTSTSTSSSSNAYIFIKALLVKLTGAITSCSERLSIMKSKNDTGLTFCSPCNNVNNATTIPFTSDIAILFRRDANVSPFNGKFILELTARGGTMGSINCGIINSTMSSSTSVSAISPSNVSTTTTVAILSQNIGFSNINVQNTSLGSTIKSSNESSSTQENTLSSSNGMFDGNWISLLVFSVAPSTDDGRLASDSQGASEKKPISTGGIIGIVLGSVGLIVIIIVLLCLLRKRKQRLGHSKGNTNFKLPKSLSVIQNLHRTSNIELHDATSSESHTFQSEEHFTAEPQTVGYENNGQRNHDYVSNYEDEAPVPHITNGHGMFPTNDRRRLNDKMADDVANEKLSRNSGSDDVTLVENQLYGESEITVTDDATSSYYAVVRPDTSSSHYDVVRPDASSSDYDVAKPAATSSDYDVVRPVVQDARTNESAEADRGYAQMKNNSADHSYYNVPIGTRVQPSAEVSGIETTDPMHNADSDVILIDNTLYGSTFLMQNH